MDDFIQQGIVAFYAGNRNNARKLFKAAILQNENDERAWDCLYSVSESDKERAESLKQILRINPNNTEAYKLLNELNTQSTLGFLNLGFKDYLAARVLLNSGLLLQGTTLALTAVEKYFKAILATQGNYSHGHLNNAHLNAVKAFDPKLYSSLNESFLLFLQKCYQLRYFDTIEKGFSLIIVQQPTLAELDYTISEIQKRFKIQRGDEKIITMYDSALSEKNKDLFLNNYILDDGDKNSYLLKEGNLVYTMRLDEIRGLIEVSYVAVKNLHNGNFLSKGLSRKS